MQTKAVEDLRACALRMYGCMRVAAGRARLRVRAVVSPSWRVLSGPGVCLVAAAIVLTAFPSLAETIRDTGLYLAPNSKIYWLDDDAVIFGGYPAAADGGVPPQLKFQRATARFFEYHYTTSQLRDRGLIGAGGPCFEGGYARFGRPVPESESVGYNGSFQGYLGSYGSEKPVTVDAAFAAAGPRLSWNCQFENELPTRPDWARANRFRRLKPEHGFLEFSESKGAVVYPVRYYRAGASVTTGIDLPPLQGLETEWPPVFEASRNAYLIGGRRVRPDTDPRYELWRLNLDGRVELVLSVTGSRSNQPSAISLPGAQLRFSSRVGPIVPLRNGRYVFDGGSFDRRGRLADSGVYLIEANAVRKLTKGRVMGLTAAPSGCRAAMGVDPQDPIAGDSFRLYILDACKD
jgi:hypothetical protein